MSTKRHAAACVAPITIIAAAGAAAGAPIEGSFDLEYRDADNQRFAARHVSTILFDVDAGPLRRIGPAGVGDEEEWFAGVDGRVTTSFDHTVAAPNGEANGFDPRPQYRSRAKVGGKFVEVFSRTTDGSNTNAPDELYTFTGTASFNVTTNYAQSDDLGGNTSDTQRAFANLDVMVTGARYGEHLGVGDYKFKMIYPASNADSAFARRATFANEDGVPVYQTVIGESFGLSNDVILHELGHLTARADGWNQSPGGSHPINGKTANTAAGRRLAYQEGWANFFAGASQRWENAQTGDGKLPDTARPITARGTHRDSTSLVAVDASAVGWAYDLEKNADEVFNQNDANKKIGNPKGERAEAAVSRIMWDLMDGTGNTEGRKDEITLGHKGFYELITKDIDPGPATRAAGDLAEFRKVVLDSTTSAKQKTRIAAIFANEGAAPAAARTAKAGGSRSASALNAGAPNAGAGTGVTLTTLDETDPASIVNPGVLEFAPPVDNAVPTITTTDPTLRLEWTTIEDYIRGDDSPQTFAYDSWAIQLFVESSSFATPLGGSGDDGSTDESAAFEYDLVGAISGVTGFEAVPTLGDRAFITDSFASVYATGSGPTDWVSFLESFNPTNADPVTFIWNVVGYNGDALTTGAWSTELRFRVVPTPGALALAGVALAGAARRSRRAG